ncbi:MAG TPA: amino acid ABC transporter substrate-binding protein [Casimicrobiaceae bacterium]|jgi:glutamate/aspartate transport system substrate-binding protein|nr:amino acid ABC transporter substrate-binding protein [Casimicrobiaceae bacterium]
MTGRRIGRLCCIVLAGYAVVAAAQSAAPAAAPVTTRAIDTLQRIRDTGTMPVGVRDAAFPFSFVDQRKRPQGYTIDICLEIAEAIKNELGLPRLEVRYVPVSPANRIRALQDGKIDLECGSTSNTRELQKEVAFAYTTFVAGIKLLARKSSQISGIDDLRGKTIVVARDTAAERMMKDINAERLLKMNIVIAADPDESFRAVDQGVAVAFPMDDVLLYTLIAKAKRPDDFAVVGRYLSVEPYAIMMRKGEVQLEEIADRTLSQLFASGEIRRLYDKWFATRELTVPLNPLLKEAFAMPNSYPAWP